MYCKKIKTWIFVVLIVILVAFFFSAMFCGGLDYPKCRGNPNGD